MNRAQEASRPPNVSGRSSGYLGYTKVLTEYMSGITFEALLWDGRDHGRPENPPAGWVNTSVKLRLTGQESHAAVFTGPGSAAGDFLSDRPIVIRLMRRIRDFDAAEPARQDRLVEDWLNDMEDMEGMDD